MALAGLRGSGDFGSDERPKDFREMILWRNPNGTAPMTALMSKAQKSGVADPEFNWWDEPTDIVRLQVNKSGGYAAGATTIVVDSSDPDASNPDNRYGSAENLKPGDILQVEKTTETTTYDNELLLVTAVVGATSFTAERGFAGTTAGTIADDAYLLKIGSAYGEGGNAPEATSRNPIKYYNYCQIFKDTYDITNTTAAITNLRTGDPVKNDKRRKMNDHSNAIEQALLWGRRNEDTDPVTGKPRRTMGGLRSYIPSSNVTIFGVATTINTLLDAVSPVFNWNSDAGNERIAFVGNGALNEVNKIVKADSGTQVQYNGKINVYGMSLMEFIFPQGTIFLKTHPLMSRNTLYNNSMFVVDPTSLRWRHVPGRDTKFEDNIQNNDEDRRRGQWLTEGGLEVSMGGLTNGYIGNISSS